MFLLYLRHSKNISHFFLCSLISGSTFVGGCNTFFPTLNVTFVNPLYDHLCQLQPLWEKGQVWLDRGRIFCQDKEKSDITVEAFLCCAASLRVKALDVVQCHVVKFLWWNSCKTSHLIQCIFQWILKENLTYSWRYDPLLSKWYDDILRFLVPLMQLRRVRWCNSQTKRFFPWRK